MKKKIYVVTALQIDSKPLGGLKQYDTEAEAIECAKSVIESRRMNGHPTLAFYVMKCVAIVAPASAPVKVTFLK